MVEKMDPNRLREGQNAMRAAQSGTEKAKRVGGVIPTAKEYVKKPFTKEFWTGKEAGTNFADHVRENAQQEHDAKYDAGKDGEKKEESGGAFRQGDVAAEGQPYNEFISAFVDVITRGHSRSKGDKATGIFNYITSEKFINRLTENPVQTPLEKSNSFYREDMVKVRYGDESAGLPGLVPKLMRKDVADLSYTELDVLFVTMLNDEHGGGRKIFFDFLLDVAKRTKNLNEVGSFKGNVLLKLAMSRTTDEDLHGKTERKGIETLLNPGIVKEYFEENHYHIIEEAIKEFEDRLPKYVVEEYELPEGLEDGQKEALKKILDERRDALNESTKIRLVDSFKQTLLSSPRMVEDAEEFGKNMPATYKKDIKEKVVEIQVFIGDVVKFVGSELTKDRLDKKLSKLKKEVSEMDDVDNKVKETLIKKLDEVERLYAKKVEKLKELSDEKKKVVSLPEELDGEDEKKKEKILAKERQKIEKINQLQTELTYLNTDIDMLRGEVEEETKQEDEVIKTAKEIVKKLKGSVTEDGVTKEQYVIETIVYEGGFRNFEKLKDSRAAIDHPFWNSLVEKAQDKLGGIVILEPATARDMQEIRMESRKLPKGLMKLKYYMKNITYYALSPDILKAWANEGGKTSKAFKKAVYYTFWPVQTALAGVYGLGCAVGKAVKWVVWDSYSRKNVKKHWWLRPFGIGTLKSAHELLKDKETMIYTRDNKKLARKGYLAYGLIAWTFAGLTTVGMVLSGAHKTYIPAFGYPNFKKSPVSVGKWYVDINPAAFTIHEKHPESKREKTQISVLGSVNLKDAKGIKSKVSKVESLDATRDRKFILQLYYPKISDEELKKKGHNKVLKEKEKQYEEQLDWLQEHPEIADFLAERTFGVKLIEYAKDGEKLGKEKRLYNDEDGNFVVKFGRGKIKDGLSLNPNKTPEFINELMAVEQALEFINSEVKGGLKTLPDESGVYREMTAEYGELPVLSAINGHLIELIEKSMGIDKEEAKEAVSELKKYGIAFDDEGKLMIADEAKLRASVVENVVKKINKYGIEYFDEEIELSKAEIDHRYMKENMRKWEDKEYIVPGLVMAYMNTYGIKSVENARFLMANPDAEKWLGNATVRRHAEIYIPEKNVETVVTMLREKSKDATEGIGIVVVLSNEKRMTVIADVTSKALEKALAVDTTEEYKIYQEEQRLAEQLGERLYPDSARLVDFIRENEVKDEWISYLYGEKTERDKTEVKNEIVAYLENQKDELVKARAKNVEKDIKEIDKELKKLNAQMDVIAQTDEEKSKIGAKILELERKKENLKKEMANPGKYLDSITDYIKSEGEKPQVEGLLTPEMEMLMELEREQKREEVIEYLKNARKEKDIMHMLMTYRSEGAVVQVIDGQLEDFIREVIQHIEAGGRASDFDAHGDTEMNVKYLENAKKEGYLEAMMMEMDAFSTSGEKIKAGINMEAYNMCEPITINMDSVIEHLAGKERYQEVLEVVGIEGIKNETRRFIYTKMETAMKDEKIKNQMLANGIKFNSKTGKAEIADAEKLADYVYEGRIKDLGKVSGISEKLVKDCEDLFIIIDGMISNDALYKKLMKQKGYAAEEMNDVVHNYLLLQLSMVREGDVPMEQKLEENGIELNDEGKPEMKDGEKVSAYLRENIFNPMRKYGLEHMQGEIEKMKQPLGVESGEPAAEGTMATPDENKKEYDLSEQGLDYSNGVMTLKDDKGRIWVKFTKEGDASQLYLMPREATEKMKEDKRVLKVVKGPLLIEKENMPVYKFVVEYDVKWSTKEEEKVKYVDMTGKVTTEE